MQTKEFEKILEYKFNDIKLLEKALTHSSYCRECNLRQSESNERLEFLGDAFLDAIAGAEIYLRMGSADEGVLTKTRALVVCEKSLAEIGFNLDIGNFLNMGNGEIRSGGRKRESIIADAVEAVIGAIFLDGGYEEAQNFVLLKFREIIVKAVDGKLFADYKTEVQEILQKNGSEPKIVYQVVGETGPDHDKTFYVCLTCNGIKLGSGIGKTKKEAEQNAAKTSIEKGLIKNVL